MSAMSELFSITVSPKESGGFAGQSGEPRVIWLTGEHDVSNASQLSQVIAETIALDHEDVVVDLAGVSFISGATVAILIRANAFLMARARALILRAPRRSTVRLLGLCGLTHLISPPPRDSVVMTHQSDALRTWVDVPLEERATPGGASSSAVPARVEVPTASELVTVLDDREGRKPRTG